MVLVFTCCSSSQIELPVWDRLDRSCGWAELAQHAGSSAVLQQVAAFRPDAILGVDWSSLPTYQALAAAFTTHTLPVPPYVYMNYRWVLVLLLVLLSVLLLSQLLLVLPWC